MNEAEAGASSSSVMMVENRPARGGVVGRGPHPFGGRERRRNGRVEKRTKVLSEQIGKRRHQIRRGPLLVGLERERGVRGNQEVGQPGLMGNVWGTSKVGPPTLLLSVWRKVLQTPLPPRLPPGSPITNLFPLSPSLSSSLLASTVDMSPALPLAPWLTCLLPRITIGVFLASSPCPVYSY